MVLTTEGGWEMLNLFRNVGKSEAPKKHRKKRKSKAQPSSKLTPGQKKYRAYLKSNEWKETRQAAVKRDGRRCQTCGSTGRLQVHHTCYDRRGKDSLPDLVTLCSTCHRKTHGR